MRNVLENRKVWLAGDRGDARMHWHELLQWGAVVILAMMLIAQLYANRIANERMTEIRKAGTPYTDTEKWLMSNGSRR